MTPHAVYALMQDKISEQKLKEVCIELGIQYGNIAGDTDNGKALELVKYCNRRDRLGELNAILSR